MKKNLTIFFFCILVLGLTGCDLQKKESIQKDIKSNVQEKTNEKAQIKNSEKSNQKDELRVLDNEQEKTIENKENIQKTNESTNTINNIDSNNNTSNISNNNIYSVKFNLEGGDKYITYNPWQRVDNYSLTVKNGETYGSATGSNMLPGATRYGNFIFDGWYTEKNGRGSKINSDTIVNLKSNLELYAYWVDAINITYKYCDDTGKSIQSDNSKRVKKDITIEKLYQEYLATDYLVNRNLYVLDGFYSTPSFTEKLSDSHVVQNNEIIYVKYIPNEYDVTIVSKGHGTVSLSSNKIKASGLVTIYANADDGYEVEHISYCASGYCNGYGKDGAIETNVHGTYGWRNKVITNYAQEMGYPQWDGGPLNIEVTFAKIK